jgi:hypothetical protein
MLGSTRRFWRRFRRTVIAAATVAAVAACAVGVPLPNRTFKPSSERYPCENHPCGCVDAEHCWRDCCCMTNAAKLAWAEVAGVTPPAYVVAAAAHEAEGDAPGHEHRDGDSPQLAAGGCCSSTSKKCCGEARSCCRGKAHVVAAAPAAAAERGVKVVHLISALKCRGLSVSIGLLPPSLPVLHAEFFPLVIERFQPSLGDSLLYDEPYLAVASPPPDGAAC